MAVITGTRRSRWRAGAALPSVGDLPWSRGSQGRSRQTQPPPAKRVEPTNLETDLINPGTRSVGHGAKEADPEDDKRLNRGRKERRRRRRGSPASLLFGSRAWLLLFAAVSARRNPRLPAASWPAKPEVSGAAAACCRGA